MSSVIAWGDESVQVQGYMNPMYYIGVCLCNSDEGEIRKTLLTAVKRRIKKLHWRDMTRVEKRHSIENIASLSLAHVVVGATPLDGTVSSERARRKCLEYLLPILEHEYDVTHLILESREMTQDQRDLQCVMGLRNRHLIDGLRVDFKPGASDARLWIADQVLGAIGDMNRGRLDASLLTEHIDMRTIDLRQRF